MNPSRVVYLGLLESAMAGATLLSAGKCVYIHTTFRDYMNYYSGLLQPPAPGCPVGSTNSSATERAQAVIANSWWY